jgi:hypothetical protein
MLNFEEVSAPNHRGARHTAHTPENAPPGPTQEPQGFSRTRAVWTATILAAACLGLGACGGSSGTSSNAAVTATKGSAGATSTSTTSTGGASTGTSSNPGSTAGAGQGRFEAVRECLQKNGVTLPKSTPGSGPPTGGAFPGGGAGQPALPKGVTRAQFQAAVAKCNGNFGARFGHAGGPGARGVTSPVFRAALAKYATCLRQHGIDIPAPNTSGKGPIFSTKGIDTASTKFKAAAIQCRASLLSAFRRPQAPAGATGTTTSK